VANWPSVVTLGEMLIDFVPLDAELPLQLATAFHRAPGGAPANVAVGLCRLGVSAAFIGKLGDDPFGQFLRQTLATENVEVRGLIESRGAQTPLAFVGADGNSSRRFVFYHNGMADTLLSSEELDRDLIAHASIFHFGSVTLSAEPSRSATLEAARWARENGLLVSFDPNVRLELWDSPQRALDNITETLACADVVKVSADEVEFLTSCSDPAEACRRLRRHGPSLAVVTLGPAGCYYDNGIAAGEVPSPSVDVVDTLGAGDAFMAGLLAGIAAHSDHSIIGDAVALQHALRFANAAGAMATTRPGAIPALPTRAQVDALLSKRRVGPSRRAASGRTV
jgi:fructokinase